MCKFNCRKNACLKFFQKAIFFTLPLFIFCGCTYPFAFLTNDEVLPKSLGSVWKPPEKIKKIQRLQYSEPIDLDILEGPLALAQVVDFSLTNNPNTALNWADVQGAIADLSLARKDYYPTIDLTTGVARVRAASPFSVQAAVSTWITAWSSTADISYTLWDFGARFAESETALRMLFAVAYAYNQELQTTIQSVTNDYYDNLYQKAVYKDRALDVCDASLVLESAEKKLNLGIANITDVVQAKTLYLNAQVNLVNQKDYNENSLVRLATDMGMAANTQFQTQEFPEELPGNEYLATVGEFIDLALENRPHIIRYKAEVMSKRAALTKARLDPLPKVVGDLDLSYNEYAGNFRSNFDLTGVFKVNFPFFEGFFYRSQIRAAKAALKRSEATMKREQDQVLSQVTTFYNNYKNAIERVSYTLAYLNAATEEFKVTLGNYKAGTGDIIQVVQAQSSLSNSRSQHTNSVKDIFVSLTNLAYASGSLINPEANSNWDSIYQFALEANQ